MIVAVALPLIAEHGAAVTTGRIARAAGIGEATIFRVFADKDELLDACVVEALRPDHVLEQLAAIPLDQPLAARLAEAADAMHAYTDRIGTVIGALIIAVVVFGYSRVFLAVSELSAVWVAMVIAGVIFGTGTLLALRPRLSGNVVAAVLVVAAKPVASRPADSQM